MSRIDTKIEVLRQTFRPLGELFSELTESSPGQPNESTSGAFLCLDPLRWAIQFFGVDPERRVKEDPEQSAERLRAKIESLVGEKPVARHQALFDIVRRLHRPDPEGIADPKAVYQGAVDLLETQSFEPGNAFSSSNGEWSRPRHWCFPADGDEAAPVLALTRFQDILDLAALYEFNLDNMRAERGVKNYEPIPPSGPNDTEPPSHDGREAVTPVLFVIRKYANRARLISKQNAPMFVAEHIQVLGPEPTKSALVESDHIDAYFMPLRGLGQWRAAFEFKVLRYKNNRTENDDQKLNQELTPAAHRILEDLFSSALINAFTQALYDANDDGLFIVFATLWWSREVRFYRTTIEQPGERPTIEGLSHRLGWCPQRKELCDRSAEGVDSDIPDSSCMSHFGRRHGEWLQVEFRGPCEPSRIFLDLSRLREDPKQQQALAGHWGFDLVEFRCDLLDRRSKKDRHLHRWADHLGDQLVLVRTTLLQKALAKEAEVAEASYSTALFAFGHHVGKLFQESGLVGFHPEDGDFDTPESQLKLTHMKMRLMLAWGVGEATRPLRCRGQGYPPRWFPEKPRSIDPRELARDIQRICQYYLSGMTRKWHDEWTIRWFVGDEEPQAQSLGELRISTFPMPMLPPFDNNNPQQPGTIAITLGLAEQLRNMRHHWIDNFDELEAARRRKEFEDVATVEIKVDHGSCSVILNNVMLHREQDNISVEDRFFVNSVEEIRLLEERALSIDGLRVVETRQPIPKPEDSNRYVQVRSEWFYHFDRVRKYQKPA